MTDIKPMPHDPSQNLYLAAKSPTKNPLTQISKKLIPYGTTQRNAVIKIYKPELGETITIDSVTTIKRSDEEICIHIPVREYKIDFKLKAQKNGLIQASMFRDGCLMGEIIGKLSVSDRNIYVQTPDKQKTLSATLLGNGEVAISAVNCFEPDVQIIFLAEGK